MFERFTDRARATVVLAQEEARRLQHNYIGTEHILLGLLREGEGVAARVLGTMGVTVSQVQAEVEKIIGRGDHAPSGHIPFTPRAKKVLELALREALHLQHNYIGTEHILLGLVREGEGVAAQVLVNRGADLQKLRTATLAELSGGGPERVAPTEGPHRTPAAEQAVAAAQQLAGTAPLGSHHLLEALARSEDSLASRVLAAVGVDAETLAAKIDELGLEGTSDLTPEQEAAGQMEVRLAGEELHIVLRDETAVELARTVTEKLNGPLRGTDPFAGPLIGLRDAALRCLDEVRTRLDPPPPAPEEPESTNLITTVIHRAMRSRLQRRNRPRSAELEADDG